MSSGTEEGLCLCKCIFRFNFIVRVPKTCWIWWQAMITCTQRKWCDTGRVMNETCIFQGPALSRTCFIQSMVNTLENFDYYRLSFYVFEHMAPPPPPPNRPHTPTPIPQSPPHPPPPILHSPLPPALPTSLPTPTWDPFIDKHLAHV